MNPIKVLLFTVIAIIVLSFKVSAFSSSSWWILPHGFLTETNLISSTIFNNMISATQISSTNFEYGNVTCKRIITLGKKFKLNMPGIQIEEIDLIKANELILKIDEIQYRHCLNINRTGAKTWIKISVHEEHINILNDGKRFEEQLINEKNAQKYKEILDEFEKYINNL